MTEASTPRGRPISVTPDIVQRAHLLRQEGATVQQIAAIIGLSIGSVSKALAMQPTIEKAEALSSNGQSLGQDIEDNTSTSSTPERGDSPKEVA